MLRESDCLIHDYAASETTTANANEAIAGVYGSFEIIVRGNSPRFLLSLTSTIHREDIHDLPLSVFSAPRPRHPSLYLFPFLHRLAPGTQPPLHPIGTPKDLFMEAASTTLLHTSN